MAEAPLTGGGPRLPNLRTSPWSPTPRVYESARPVQQWGAGRGSPRTKAQRVHGHRGKGKEGGGVCGVGWGGVGGGGEGRVGGRGGPRRGGDARENDESLVSKCKSPPPPHMGRWAGARCPRRQPQGVLVGASWTCFGRGSVEVWVGVVVVAQVSLARYLAARRSLVPPSLFSSHFSARGPNVSNAAPWARGGRERRGRGTWTGSGGQDMQRKRIGEGHDAVGLLSRRQLFASVTVRSSPRGQPRAATPGGAFPREEVLGARRGVRGRALHLHPRTQARTHTPSLFFSLMARTITCG